MSTPRRVADIRLGAASSVPNGFTVLGSTLFFSASDSSSGRELWKTDGTTTREPLGNERLLRAPGLDSCLLNILNADQA